MISEPRFYNLIPLDPDMMFGMQHARLQAVVSANYAALVAAGAIGSPLPAAPKLVIQRAICDLGDGNMLSPASANVPYSFDQSKSAALGTPERSRANPKP